MPLFFGNTIDTARLKRENDQLRAERDAFEHLAAENSREVWNLQQDLIVAQSTQPANLTEVTQALKAFIPSLAYAPGYSSLATAKDAQSYAMALNLLLQHARLVGRQEGQPK